LPHHDSLRSRIPATLLEMARTNSLETEIEAAF
jgi:hypothetical protein